VNAYDITRIDDLERLPVGEEGLIFRPIRRTVGISSFGVNAWTTEGEGECVVEEHTERTNGHEELYVVLSGRARFIVGDKEIDARAGTLVHIRDPEVRRTATAVEAGTTVLAIGAAPGVAFEPSAWEETYVAYAYRRLGDVDRAGEVMQAAVERHPTAWQGHYHLACFAALDGDRDGAIAHLERAVELGPEAAKWAADDADLAAIRDDPRFPQPA
jgi:tetratricopeptide (TPR) repeat protein